MLWMQKDAGKNYTIKKLITYRTRLLQYINDLFGFILLTPFYKKNVFNVSSDKNVIL